MTDKDHIDSLNKQILALRCEVSRVTRERDVLEGDRDSYKMMFEAEDDAQPWLILSGITLGALFTGFAWWLS